jgi:hypothetical protein
LPTGRCQLHTAARAYEQRHTKPYLKIADPPADRGFLNTQSRSGTPEAAEFRSRHHIANMSQFNLGS